MSGNPSHRASPLRRAEPDGALGDLVIALRRFAAESDVMLERFGRAHGLGRADINAILWIVEGEAAGQPVTLGALAARLGLGSPATTALVDRLEASGHVVRTRDPRDRRRVTVSMQGPARELAAEFFVPVGRFMVQASAGLGEDRLAAAAQVVQRMSDALVDTRTWHEGRDPAPGHGSSATRSTA